MHLPISTNEGRSRLTRLTKFQADPEWIEKRAQTEADGAIVARVENMMLRPTSFSAVK